MQNIIDYLETKYDPECLILYGSYADGTFNANSDLDALILADVPQEYHDVSVVEGIQLDVFVYPASKELKPENYPQLYHCRIVIDRKGRGQNLCDAVKNHIDHSPVKSCEEIEKDIVWCEKMLSRAQRADAEGYYRWHWVLCDSLEFYSAIRGWYYFGPKKTLLLMKKHDPVAYAIYFQALREMNYGNLARWVDFLKRELHG